MEDCNRSKGILCQCLTLPLQQAVSCLGALQFALHQTQRLSLKTVRSVDASFDHTDRGKDRFTPRRWLAIMNAVELAMHLPSSARHIACCSALCWAFLSQAICLEMKPGC